MTAAFTVATLSQIGRRKRNEDRYGDAVSHDGRRRIWAVADGVGGHPGGDVAAEAAVRGALAYIARADTAPPLDEAVSQSLLAAQDEVARSRDSGSGNAGMATTIALAISDGTSIAWGHVGDTRVYRVRGYAVERLTRDHSVAEAMRALTGRGESDEDLPEHGNVLLSSLGDAPTYEVSAVEPLHRDDVYLICSDGLWSRVSKNGLAEDLQASQSLDDWLQRLTLRVESAGDPRQDNFTAIAFRPAAGSART